MTPELSLVIPTYNERENIRQTLLATIDALAHRSFEIIVVDDNSPDRTWEIVEQIASLTPCVRLVRRTQGRRDQGQAMIEGFRLAQGIILGKMDADGSHDPRAINLLIEALNAGFEVAVGSRYASGSTICSWPIRRRLLSKVSTLVVRAALGLVTTDPLSGFWIIRREVFERAAKFPISGGFKVLLQLCVRGRPCSITEVPIEFHDRMRGHSKLNSKLLFQGLAMIVSLASENLRQPAKPTNDE